MTSWAAVPFVEVLNRVVNFEICLENGAIKSRSDPVWKEICKVWKQPSGKYLKTPITLYLDVTQNRYNIFTRYLKEHCLQISTNLNNKRAYLSDDEESVDDTETNNKFMNFNIVFSEQEWLKIKPTEKKDCNNKAYYSLQSGWTTIISELIYVTQKLPCAFSFPKQFVTFLNTENDVAKYILKVSGHCTEKLCHAAILGECVFTFSENKNVTMLIHTSNSMKIPHTKKRHVTGEQRKKFAKDMELQKGEQYKRNLIKKYQQYGEQAPPIIPNQPVLNQIRSEGKKARLGIEGSLWESLINLKYNHVELCDVIKQVGFDKFFVYYWTHQQKDLYNDLLKLNPIVSIDATGGVVRKISSAGNRHQGPIFLYQIVTYIGPLIIPVCQMLSERHDAKIVVLWLLEWISSGANIPEEVVTDMSEALQNGICLAFCNMTYKQYLSSCFKFLLGKTENLPRPFLRVDIAHLIHNLATDKCFSSAKFVVKDFYLRAIGLMSTMENFSDIEKLMKALLNISQNEYGCKDDIQWVLQKLETFKFDETVIDYKKIKKSNTCEEDLCETHLFCHDGEANVDDSNSDIDLELSEYVDKLIKEIPKIDGSNISINFNDINPYYLVNILDKLKKLFKKFTSWTNVMRKSYGSENLVATSCRSENYFNLVKDTVLDERQTTRADMFLVEHVDTINTRMVEGRAAYDKELMIEKVTKKPKKINASELNCLENWRNQNKVNEDTIEPESTKDTVVDDDISFGEIDEILMRCKINNDNGMEISQKSDSEPNFEEVLNAEFAIEPSVEIISDSSTNDFLSEKKGNSTFQNSNLNLSKPKFNSTPKSCSHSFESLQISYEKSVENSFSISLDNKPIKFRIHEKKIQVKPKVSTSCQPVERGKYLTPFPAIKVLHENAVTKKAKNYKKRKMIKNGARLGSRKVGKLRISFKNTCPFDSILELLSFAYLYFKNFRNFIDEQKSKTEFLEVLVFYSELGATAEFYSKRFNLLRKIYPEKDYTINCVDDVTTLIRNFLIHYGSVSEHLHCSKCQSFSIQQISVLNINATLVWENGFSFLQDSILQEVQKETFYCKKCKEIRKGRRVNTGTYLCLDINHFYEKILCRKNGKKELSTTNLKELPVNLDINNKKYILTGVIEFQSSDDPKLPGHYVTYTRSINGKWTELNDLLESPIILTNKSANARIALLFYVLI